MIDVPHEFERSQSICRNDDPLVNGPWRPTIRYAVIARFGFGLAWSIASVFVIPVIVREEQGANPLNVLKKSAGILKRTWGEALIGYAGLTVAHTLIVIGSVVLLMGALFASIALNNYWLIAVTGVLWLFAMFEARPKSFHSRPLYVSDGCVHFADHTPSVGLI